ncbi:MAG: dihydrodipicolinate synthase family protein [Bryobacteraceae bacterium]|nr:dihydrodipicolinate synthase family protein [Bryobacteraceae bacterium]
MPLPEGVYAAAVTPRRLGMQDINLAVMWDVLDFLCERKVKGIVLLGSTGEFVHFSISERMRMMGLAPRRSRVPVIINVSHTNFDGAVELAQAAAASGAAGVLLMPPHFFRYSDDAIRTFVLRFVEESDIPIPVLLYNLPQFTSLISFAVAEDLLRSGAVQGIKDSSGDMNYLSSLIELRKSCQFTLLVGNDTLISRALPLGVDGVISGVAAALPELLVALHHAYAAGKPELMANLDLRLHEFIGWIDHFSVPVGVREAVSLRGLKLGPDAVPFSPVQAETLADFRAWFPGWLKTVLSECKDATA